MTTVFALAIMGYRKGAYKMPKVTRSYEVKNKPTTIRLTDHQEKIVQEYMSMAEIPKNKNQAIGELIEKGHELMSVLNV